MAFSFGRRKKQGSRRRRYRMPSKRAMAIAALGTGAGLYGIHRLRNRRARLALKDKGVAEGGGIRIGPYVTTARPGRKWYNPWRGFGRRHSRRSRRRSRRSSRRSRRRSRRSRRRAAEADVVAVEADVVAVEADVDARAKKTRKNKTTNKRTYNYH